MEQVSGFQATQESEDPSRLSASGRHSAESYHFFPASTQLINPNQHTVSYVLLCMFYKVGVLENSEEVLLFVLHQGGTLIFIIG